jgi:hypothetical protein
MGVMMEAVLPFETSVNLLCTTQHNIALECHHQRHFSFANTTEPELRPKQNSIQMVRVRVTLRLKVSQSVLVSSPFWDS